MSVFYAKSATPLKARAVITPPKPYLLKSKKEAVKKEPNHYKNNGHNSTTTPFVLRLNRFYVFLISYQEILDKAYTSFVALSIINTLFMTIFERSYELGVLSAIGTNKWHLCFMLIFESLALGVLGVFVLYLRCTIYLYNPTFRFLVQEIP